MRYHYSKRRSNTVSLTIGMVFLSLLGLLTLSGCSLVGEDEGETPLKETEIEVQVRQTILAQEETLQATYSKGSRPTDTIQVIEPNVNSTESAQLTSQASPTTQSQTTPISTEELLEKMKSANILLFEDMANRSNTTRYVKDTLDSMGLPYKDDGGAIGLLKKDLLNGAPDDQPWDLIIIALENKTGVVGEYFDYINDALEQGSSLILEIWYLDQSYFGTARPLFDQCGVEFETDLPSLKSPMYILDSKNPIMNEPNSDIDFAKIGGAGQKDSKGDLVKKAESGDATMLVGIIAGDTDENATVSVCMNDRFILQTFHSHLLPYIIARNLWENYIFNALRARFES